MINHFNRVVCVCRILGSICYSEICNRERHKHCTLTSRRWFYKVQRLL